MDIKFSYKAVDQFGRLPFELQERIRDKVRFFMGHPNFFVLTKYIAIKKCYRFRVGNYRLSFIVKNQVAEIVSIERRDKAYD